MEEWQYPEERKKVDNERRLKKLYTKLEEPIYNIDGTKTYYIFGKLIINGFGFKKPEKLKIP